MNIKTKISLVIICTVGFFSLLLSSCKSECKCSDAAVPVCGSDGITYGSACAAECYNVTYTKGECPVELDGVVKVFGLPTDEDCNLFILMGRNHYRPLSLDTVFQHDELPVRVTFRGFGNYVYCDSLNRQISKIEVLKISKR